MIPDRLAASVSAVYDAALSPGLSPVALERLRDAFGLVFAASVTRSIDASRVEGIAAGVDPAEYRAFLDRFYRQSPFLRASGPWRSGSVTRSAALVPHRVFHRSRMYQEFWRPHDMHEGLRLQVASVPGGGYHTINLIRSRRAEEFSDGDLALAGALMPHLQRAAAIRHRLAEADLAVRDARAALDALPHSILLLDASGRILHLNAAADRLLGARAGLGTAGGVLEAASPAQTARLRALTARAAAAPREAGALRLPRADAQPLLVLTMPLSAGLAWPLAAASVLMCIVDPAANGGPPGRVLIELFGLTAAEAALAVDLLGGHDLGALARRSGRSRNTLRAHLASLMDKTATSRQSDLLRRIAAIPALRWPPTAE